MTWSELTDTSIPFHKDYKYIAHHICDITRQNHFAKLPSQQLHVQS